MTFQELTASPIIVPTPALQQITGVDDTPVDFFILIQRHLFEPSDADEEDVVDVDYPNFGHYVILGNNFELFQNGIMEVRNYNFGINVVDLVALFAAQEITWATSVG